MNRVEPAFAERGGMVCQTYQQAIQGPMETANINMQEYCTINKIQENDKGTSVGNNQHG